MVRSDYELIDMVTGYQPAAAVAVGLELGVFDALSHGRATSLVLADSIGCEEGALHSLVEALAALGLVERDGSGYRNSSYVAERVAGGGPMASVIRKEAFFARAWQRLEEVVRTGEPAVIGWAERVSADPESAYQFLIALDALATATGPDLATLPELAPHRTVGDLGGGLGTYSVQLANAGSTVVLVDLPPVVGWARRAAGDVPRLSMLATDVFSHPSAGLEESSFDAILVSHVLHDLSFDRAVDLLRRAKRALAPGGHLVVNDFAGDAGPGAFGPLFDVMMRVETGGAAYPLAGLKAMIEEAGFSDPRRADFEEPATVLIATNRGVA